MILSQIFDSFSTIAYTHVCINNKEMMDLSSVIHPHVFVNLCVSLLSGTEKKILWEMSQWFQIIHLLENSFGFCSRKKLILTWGRVSDERFVIFPFESISELCCKYRNIVFHVWWRWRVVIECVWIWDRFDIIDLSVLWLFQFNTPGTKWSNWPLTSACQPKRGRAGHVLMTPFTTSIETTH